MNKLDTKSPFSPYLAKRTQPKTRVHSDGVDPVLRFEINMILESWEKDIKLIKKQILKIQKQLKDIDDIHILP